ncbi:MAG: hypothetical protein ACRENK_05455, partial [Gemmatimonadaceae bacterium]
MLRRTPLIYLISVSLVVICGSAAAQETSPLSLPVKMPVSDSKGNSADSAQYDERALRFESHRGAIRIL